MTSDCKPKLKE